MSNSALESSLSCSSQRTLLREIVARLIEEYLRTLDGQAAKQLHSLVLREVELGLFKTVLKYTSGNQSKAATWLGLSRGTLRKRLAQYGLDA